MPRMNFLPVWIILFSIPVFTNCQKPEENTHDGDNGTQASFKNVDTLGQVILGSPTESSIRINLLFSLATTCQVDFSTDTSNFKLSSGEINLVGDVPGEVLLSNLAPGKRYYYRLKYKAAGNSGFQVSPVYSFMTQRGPGSSFSFGIQGDSHPEREGKMFSGELYKRNMKNVASEGVDFYFTLGDDFSIEKLIESGTVSQGTVDNVYASHRPYLGIAGSNASIFLVNGNHEQAGLYLLDGTPVNPAVCAANARKKYYPVPLPDDFYSGNTHALEYIGLPGDYYSFTWGDALFVVIDPYWHSPIEVDGKGGKNLWDITFDDEQYNWFKSTLESSGAKYKFVFTHHVLGTGRGGIEQANLYEWGGYNKNGTWEFDTYRPGWALPIHQLMVQNGVTIFFQGHDHLFCKQELDGVIYQSVPNPADNTYTAFNAEDYLSGTILPNSGFLKVTVEPQQVQVEYIGAFLPTDESSDNMNGMVKFTYSVSK